AEVCAVEEVEHLDAELEAAIGDTQTALLGEGEVHCPQVGTGEIASSRVSEGTGWLQDECRRVEPLRGIAGYRVVGAEAVGVARTLAADAGPEGGLPLRARAVVLDEHGQRIAAAHRGDTRHAPAAEQ